MEHDALSRPTDSKSAGLVAFSYAEFELLCNLYGLSAEDSRLIQELSKRDWLVTSSGLTYYGNLDVAALATPCTYYQKVA